MPSASGFARRLYDALPPPLKRPVAWVPFAVRVGPEYRKTLRFLESSERWSAERHRVQQARSLRALLEGAVRNVPYYRRRYAGLDLSDPWRALAAIEPIEKKTIQADPRQFRDETLPDSATYVTSTGGTTGRPLEIVLDRSGFQTEWAFMIAQWRRAGFVPGARRATFRGVAFPGGRTVQENPVYDELQLSPFAMSDATLPAYVARIRAYRPGFLYGYPSALTILAKWVEAHPEADFPPIHALLCGSENVQEGQREYLERVFGARFFSWYGMSEKVILAGECELGARYHAFPQYGVTEILGDDGRLSTAVGARGELVGTGFMNRAMPFIRYRTGDYSELVGDRCDACGRAFPLLGPVRGRWVQEMVVGRSGARISLTALNMHGEVFKGVERFQFHQRERGLVTLRIVKGPGAASDAEARILRALVDKTGVELGWTVEPVREITLSPRGKGVFLVQELDER
jgi:phenylacetate-CoA ligase